MLRCMDDLKDYTIEATNGRIGHAEDFYFDDETWAIRYLVVDTGNWLSGRKVLISPIAIGHPDRSEKMLPVSMTKQQVQNSPGIDTGKPITRQQEMLYLDYYGYPFYWGRDGLWAGGAYPSMMMAGSHGFVATPQADLRHTQRTATAAAAARQQDDDIHLRSCKEMTHYHIHADGEIGHVDGMLIDEETWAVRYLIVNTGNWWSGHQVLIAPHWIQRINRADFTLSVNLTRQALQDAPAYDATLPFSRQQEVDLHAHYGLIGYWEYNGENSSENNSENPDKSAIESRQDACGNGPSNLNSRSSVHNISSGRKRNMNANTTNATDMLKKTDIAIAIYDLHTQAEDAVKALERAGFDMRQISIIGKDYHTEEHVVGFLNMGDRAKIFGKLGAFWGGLMGVLFGSAMMFIPVLGHIIVLGPIAAAIFSGVEGALLVGGLSALVGALMSVGIPRDSVLRYETALKADKFMLVVHGSRLDIETARETLKDSPLSSFDHHQTNEEETREAALA
jgi:hypothetical protein